MQQTQFIYGIGGLIATPRAGQLNFIFEDHLGSTRVVVASDGGSGVGYAYDALGNVVEQSAFGTPTSAIAYQYTGQEFDSETGLRNFRARLYDDDLFRFYAIDPAGQQFSGYAFVGNNPLIYVDPSAQWFLIDDLIMAAVSFTAGYINHGIREGNWGWDAVKEGGILAAQGVIALNTGGASAGFWNAAGWAGSSIASSYLPSYGVGFGNFGYGISPNFSFGSNGFNLGFDISAMARIGNVAIGGSVGARIGSGTFNTGGYEKQGVFAGYTDGKNFAFLSSTWFSGNGMNEFNQRVSGAHIGGEKWNFSLLNDLP